MNKNRLSFGKSFKLCSLERINEVFTKGKVIYSYPFKLFYLPVEGDLPHHNTLSKVLISIPKKSFKSAVKRNRIKRLIRESLRQNKFYIALPHPYDIAIIYIAKELPLYSTVDDRIKYVLEKLKKDSQESFDISIPSAD